MPVVDGRPTEADIRQAFRMVSDPAVLPGDDRPWLWAYNRASQWTIDAAGRYVRFPGRKVGDFGLSFIHEASTKRVLTAAEGDLLKLDHDLGFVPIAKVAKSIPRSISLLRVERLDLTLAITHNSVLRLRGDVVEPWSEGFHVAGEGWLQAFDLPALHAALFLPADRTLKLRQDDGAWVTLGRRDHDGSDYWVERVDQSPVSSTALIWLRKTNGGGCRLLALFGDSRDGPVRLVEIVPCDRDAGVVVLLATATGEILRLEQPARGAKPAWSRVTAKGYQPIEGGLAPRWLGETVGLSPVHVQRRRAMIFETDEGLAIYQDGRMRLAPGPAPAGLGPYAHIVDLPALRRTLIVSTHGLFELKSDDRIVRVEAPFTTGGWSGVEIFEDAKRRQAIIRGPEGLFTLDRRGTYRRIAAPRPVERPHLDHVATLAVSGDHLLDMDNALWLLISPSSPRWAACRARSGVEAKGG